MTLLRGESIQSLFDTISSEYDQFNSMASLGMDRRWRQKTIEVLSPGMKILDVGCGTGDMTFAAFRYLNQEAEIDGLDFSKDMLTIAKKKQLSYGFDHRISWINKSATDLPINEKTYDAVISGFVLRNLHEIIHECIRGIFDSLKPGGILSIVDLTEPDNRFLRFGARVHMHTVISMFGRICFKDAAPVNHLKASMKHFFRAHEFKALLRLAGFRGVMATPYCFGAVSHYTAYKPTLDESA